MPSSLSAIQSKLWKARPIPFQAFLTSDGTPTGDSNAIGDYSVTPQDFYFDVANNPGAFTVITSIEAFLSALPIPPSIADYGEVAGGLTNGFRVWYERTLTGRVNITDLIKTNQDLSMIIGDMIVQTWDDTFTGVPTTLNFRGSYLNFGAGIILPKSDDALIGITLNDNFAAVSMDAHIFQVRGYFLDNPENWIS